VQPSVMGEPGLRHGPRAGLRAKHDLAAHPIPIIVAGNADERSRGPAARHTGAPRQRDTSNRPCGWALSRPARPRGPEVAVAPFVVRTQGIVILSSRPSPELIRARPEKARSLARRCGPSSSTSATPSCANPRGSVCHRLQCVRSR
jgi:hypothetical protein